MLHADLPPAEGGGGGVRHQVAGLADALTRRGHEVVAQVLVADGGGRTYPVRRAPIGVLCGTNRSRRIVLAPLAFAANRYSPFDLVHAHGDSELLFRRRIPVVRTFYGSARDEARHAVNRKHRALQQYHHVAERIARRLASRTVGISRVTSEAIGPLDHIIPCGVDRTRFRPGAKAKQPTILFIGTMRGRKRGAMLARVFREVVRPRVPDARLVMVAPDSRGEPGIESIPTIDDERLAEHLRSAWVFTLPSSYEGFGVPYIEAMASGTAVVATPNAGARELLSSGDGGVLVTDDELGDALSSLLVDESRRDALAAGGVEVARRFDWNRIAAAYERIYEELVAK
jgi:glycosyltransferase involved in cell wall biosynthesis